MGSLHEKLQHIDELAEGQKLPGLPAFFAVLYERGGLSLGLYAPQSIDTQGPHDRDEIYIISSGSGQFRGGEDLVEFKTGDFLFAPAGIEHRFERFSADFRVWVIFFGP